MIVRILRRLFLASWMPALVAAPRGAGAQEPLTWGEMQREMAAREFTAPDLRSAYGPGPHRFGELRLPEGEGPWPVLVVIHGGCWQSIAGLEYMDAFATAVNRLGWATWSLEFRRTDQPGGEWPGILEDVAAGADHLRTLAEGLPLDLERVVTAGHSSGGHLALWLAARPGLPADVPGGPRLRGSDPLAVRGTVGLAPIADLADYDRYTRCGPRAVTGFLGEDPALRGERFALTDPLAMGPADTPRLLVFGDADPIVPPAHGEAYRARSGEDGRRLSLVTVAEAGHFELVAPWTSPWRTVEDTLIRFLDLTAPGGTPDRRQAR